MSTTLVSLRRRGSPRSAATGSAAPVAGLAYVETYGCQMNVGDSEILRGALERRGYVVVDDPAGADVIVVNTCAVREHAETRVRGRIGQLQSYRRLRPELVLAVTGCMAQRLGADLLAEAGGVDVVAGPDSYRRLGELVDAVRHGAMERGQVLLEQDADAGYEGMPRSRTAGVTAWVTVQRGCDHRCTFCIVPYVRGPEKNRSPQAVLEEARRAVDGGYTEITLLGQTVNSYRHGGTDFAALLRRVARLPGVRRVRFTSPHPNDVTDALLGVMADEPAVCPQLHLPVQSGSDRILRRMVRRYARAGFLATVHRARRQVPDIALSTDVIAGFPGEMEEDFEQTLDLLRDVRFEDAYLYRFSPREGTPATRFPAEDFVDEKTGGQRLERLIELQRRIQREIGQAQVGGVREVLVERAARSEGDVLGRTPRNEVVVFPGAPSLAGSYRDVRLVGSTGSTFLGREERP